MLDTGLGSTVLETADGVIFRVARTADAATGHSRERALLAALREAVTVYIPAPEWRVEPGHAHAMPFGAIGYRKLGGAPLSPDLLRRSNRIGEDVARFLSSLHRFPVEEAKRLSVPRGRDWRQTVAILESEVLPALHEHVTQDEYRSLARWVREVAADRDLDHYRPALCHGDLWFENLLVAGEPLRLVGVLDWEAARIGDPAQDLDVQLYLGEPFAGSVMAGYGVEESNLPHRVQRFWELREFGGLQWALEQRDRVELEDSLAKLRAGPILRSRQSRTR